MTDLQGRQVIVTGAATGIGWAISEHFASLGARVALLDLDADRVRQRADQLNQTAGAGQARHIAIACDVGDEASSAEATTVAADFLGGLDTLVNNAATFTPTASVVDLSLDDWEAAIRVNLTGAFLMCKAAIPLLRSAGGGAIINIASQLGSVGAPGRAPYCAAKGGILQLTRVLALDHAADGIRVNSLSPGAVLTERLTRLFGSPEQAVTALAGKHPIGRLGDAAEIARAAAFLASSDASFMTGADLLADGGYNAQ